MSIVSSNVLFDDSFRFPDDLRDRRGGRSARVAVIGAGVGGLAAAHELQRHGFDTTIFERTVRPGGRVRTLRFWDGTHGELGAMRIPGNHWCTLRYVHEFGLATRQFVNSNPEAYYHLRGTRVRRRDVEVVLENYRLGTTERQDPLLLCELLLRDAWHGLTPAQRQAVMTGEVLDAELESLASTSLWQYVRDRISPEAWDLIGHATGLMHYEHASLLEVLVDYFGLFNVEQIELVDGMEALIRAFTQTLTPGTLRLSTRISELHITGDGVRISGERFATPFVEDFDFVVCAVPAPSLDQIVITPQLPALQQQAVRGINYASSSKTLLHLRERPWESVDGIFGGGSFTDLPIQQVWYPSDNARIGGTPAPTALDPDRSHAPSVLTAAYLWENNARRFAALPEADRTRIVLRSLEKLHPGIAGVVDDVVHWTWDEQVGIGGGAFAYFSPGQQVRYANEIAAPHPHEAPRIFFAGEHLSVAHAWIQGALQSALVAVGALLDHASVPRAV